MNNELRNSHKTTNSSSRRGTAMVELAIVLPFLLLLLLGIIEMGRVMMLHQVTTNACREAVRRAIIPGMTTDQVRSVAASYLDAGSISPTGREILILNESGVAAQVESIQSHEAVTVEIHVPYANNTWGFSRITGNSIAVSRATMRRE